MNVLVIGGTGFIGSHVCDSLLRAGHTVSVYSRHDEKHRNPLKSITYFKGDISDTTTLSEALIGMDSVVHLASTTVPATSNLNPAHDVSSNLIHTIELLELLRKNGPKKIIFISSGGTVYGEPLHLPVSESHPLNPICSYGVVKVAIENYMNIYQKQYGIESVIMRVSNPYGPRQGHMGVQGLISAFLNRVKNGQDLIVWGDGETIRDYIYISDIVTLLDKALSSSVTGVFNAGSGQGFSINQVIDVICKVTNMNPTVIYKESRAFDVSKIYLDTQKAQEAFDWQVNTDLFNGINKHWEWLLQAS